MKHRECALVLVLLQAGISSAFAQNTVTEKLAAPSDATKIDRVAANENLGRERSRLNNAAEKRAFLANAVAQLEQSKAPLFDALGKAAPSKLAPLKTLMAETMLSMHLSHLSDLAEGGNDLAKGKGLALVQARADSEVKIRALLGADGYSIYLAYQQSEPYRGLMHQLVQRMRATGSEITAGQEQALLERYVSAVLKAADASVKEASPALFAGLNAAERRALGRAELCGQQPVIAGPQKVRFESYLTESVADILSPKDLTLFQHIRSEPEITPDWHAFVPAEFSKNP